MGRRWVAWFDREHLVLKRQRLLPWSKRDVKWIGTEAILDIRPTSAAGWAKGKADVTVQNPVAPQRIEVFEVQFAAQHWLRADWLIRHRLVSSPARPDSEPTTTPSPTHTPANVEDPTPPQERAKPVVQAPSVPRLPNISEIAALPQAPPRRSTIAAIRADDGKGKCGYGSKEERSTRHLPQRARRPVTDWIQPK